MPKATTSPTAMVPLAHEPGASLQAATQGPAEQGTEAGRCGDWEARRDRLEDANREQHAAKPGDERREQQMRRQRYRLTCVYRAARGVEGSGAQGDHLGDRRRSKQSEVEPQAPPRGYRGSCHLHALLADLPAQRSTARDVQGQCGREHPDPDPDQSRRHEISRGLKQRGPPQDRHYGQEAEPNPEQRADAGKDERPVEEHPQQVTAMRPGRAGWPVHGAAC